MVTATYKKKKYQCRVTVKAGKKKKPAADHPMLNSSDITLYYLSDEYKDCITYDSSHLREYRFRVSGTRKVLYVKNMTHLVHVYDAIKKLNKLLLGEWEIYGRDGGVLEELDRVCDVIEHGICAEIRLRGEDEMYEYLADVLDDAEKAPEERAKLLTGQDKE